MPIYAGTYGIRAMNKQVCQKCIEGLEKRVTKRLNDNDYGKVWSEVHFTLNDKGKIDKVSYRVDNKKTVEHNTDYCEMRCRFKLEHTVMSQ